MEITRKYKDDNHENKTEIIKKPIYLRIFSIYKIYDIIAKYGQSCKRPFLFEVLIIMCGLVYFTCKGFTIENSVDPFHYGVTQTLLSITPFNSLSQRHRSYLYYNENYIHHVYRNIFYFIKAKIRKKV